MNFWLIFLTGLTTGGLTCLAVQGGLLATAITSSGKDIEDPVQAGKRPGGKRTKHKTSRPAFHLDPQQAWPVVYFLTAKLVAYTLLGAFLGLLGSVVQITTTAQAIMQIVVAVYMLITALNMMEVHPIFRYFVIQPPKAFTRLARQGAKSEHVFGPALLGLLTILIPCGTTQAMEVLAIGSGSPLTGALVMFLFVLGTSPTFFVLGFVATQLRGPSGQWFTRGAVVLMLILAVISFNGGLVALGSPLAPSRILAKVFPGSFGMPVAAQVVDGRQEITMQASAQGYSPNYFTAQSGQPIRLKLITHETLSCSRLFTIPNLGIEQQLPLTGETVIDLPAQPTGEVFFTCSMGMYSGLIKVEEQAT